MQWLGLSLVEASLLFGALAAVLTALYLAGRNLPLLRVPYLPFWGEAEGRSAGARSLRLRSPLSLLLALVIVLLLVLALGEPRFGASRPARTLVILLDHSASMAANDEQPSRLELAKRVVSQQASTLRSEDKLVLLALADRAAPIARAGADQATLTRALDALRPSDEAGDLARGVESALALLSGERQPELLLLSDGNLRGVDEALALLRSQPHIEAHQVTFGKQGRNLAVTGLSARPYTLDRAHQELLVTVHNAGRSAETVELVLSADRTPLLRETMTVPARSSVTRTFRDLVQAGEMLRARLIPALPDVLPRDDQRETSLPVRSPTRVVAFSRGNRYLEAALLLEDYLHVSVLAPEAPFDPAQYDVAIFDGVLPKQPAPLPALFFAPYERGETQPLPTNGTRARPYFEHWDREHPLLRGLGLGDVNVARAARTSPRPGDVVLASAGSGLPLIVEGVRNEQPFLALTFDIRESDLPLRAAFPLFVLAAVQRLGQPDDPAPTRPDASAGASDVQTEPQPLLPAAPRTAPLASRAPWQLLALAALLLLAVEWLTFQRRVTS